MRVRHTRIVGAGLIGTSIGLALRSHGISVDIVDSDPRAEAIASDLLASPTINDPVDLVILATPISALATVIESEFSLNPQASFIDVASVKIKPLLDMQASNLPAQQFLPTHPMAGREVGGAESARGDLFRDRPWIIDPSGVDGQTLERGREVIALCGATIYELPASEHDRAVALISHLPQLTASLLAAKLTDAPSQWLELAGGGLRDTTRIAASDARLWGEIIAANASAIKPLLLSMKEELATLIINIDNPRSVENFITKGNVGRAHIPGKHGGAARSYTQLPVIIEDKPGQLAALFDECDSAGVNVEDISIEHSPGQLTGLVLLSLSAEHAVVLEKHLATLGWAVHSPRGGK